MKINGVLLPPFFLLSFFILTAFSEARFLQDTLRILAIRVEFQPDDATTTTGDGTFDLSSGSDPFQIDPPPHNRSYFQDHLLFLKNYFHKISRGRLVIEAEVFPLAENEAYRLDFPMAHYNPNTTPEEINTGIALLLRDAILKADEDPAIDFNRYDSFIVFHAGVGKDIDVGFDTTPQDIPSLFVTQDFLQEHLGIAGIAVDEGNVQVRNGIILPETESQEGFQLGLNGMLVSNFGSQLGWLDLFSPVTLRSGVGRFGVMDAGLFNGDGLLPALPSAWTRIDAGWETAVSLYQAQREAYPIHHVLSGKEPRVYRIPINENEYFLLENRHAGRENLDSLQFELSRNRGEQATMKEVLLTFVPEAVTFSERGVLIDVDNPDRGLPGSGILIWHIDENIIQQNRRLNQINADPDHRGVDVEEADGSQDIGQVFDFLSAGAGSELGTALDLWYRGNPAPLFRNEFSDQTVPNSRSYANRAYSHIRVYDFSGPDSSMQFHLDLNFFQTDFPRSIDRERYGRIVSLKSSDLDGDGTQELIMSTDRNQILVMNASGYSGWGNDSLSIVHLGDQILPPPALFSMPGRNKGMVLTTKEGRVYGYEFNQNTHTLDTLFSPVQCNSAITTFPIVEFNEVNGSVSRGDGVVDSLPNIYWGCADGGVYRLSYDNGGWQGPDNILSLSGPIVKLHFADPSRVVALSSSGSVVILPDDLQVSIDDVFRPVGSGAIAVTREGIFIDLLNQKYPSPENSVHRFDGPPIAIANDNGQTQYLLAGNNQVYIFNYNFTLEENFPIALNLPPRSTEFFISPLVAPLPSLSKGSDMGIIVVDPVGVIHGFDFRGQRLPDFPLAIGDSIDASPVLADLDGDADIELACVSRAGWVYVWDFPSTISTPERSWYWLQEWGNEMNQNRAAPAVEPQPAPSPFGADLLPAEKAYNWPNPNVEDFTFIRYWLRESAEVTIRIYDTAGDLVDEFKGPGFPLTHNEVRWNLSGVQSGVYFARIEARSARQKAVRIIKIAVIK